MLTISFPTKTTSGPPPSTAANAAPALRGSLAKALSSAPSGSDADERSSSSARAATSAIARSCSRGRKRDTSTPGGPSLVRASSPGSAIVSHRLSAVWREPTSTALAGARPSRARPTKRSGSGLTVYSSALPWTFTA